MHRVIKTLLIIFTVGFIYTGCSSEVPTDAEDFHDLPENVEDVVAAVEEAASEFLEALVDDPGQALADLTEEITKLISGGDPFADSKHAQVSTFYEYDAAHDHRFYEPIPVNDLLGDAIDEVGNDDSNDGVVDESSADADVADDDVAPSSIFIADYKEAFGDELDMLEANSDLIGDPCNMVADNSEAFNVGDLCGETPVDSLADDLGIDLDFDYDYEPDAFVSGSSGETDGYVDDGYVDYSFVGAVPGDGYYDYNYDPAVYAGYDGGMPIYDGGDPYFVDLPEGSAVYGDDGASDGGSATRVDDGSNDGADDESREERRLAHHDGADAVSDDEYAKYYGGSMGSSNDEASPRDVVGVGNYLYYIDKESIRRLPVDPEGIPVPGDDMVVVAGSLGMTVEHPMSPDPVNDTYYYLGGENVLSLENEEDNFPNCGGIAYQLQGQCQDGIGLPRNGVVMQQETRLNAPKSLTAEAPSGDNLGCLYIADSGNQAIRKFNIKTGRLSTVWIYEHAAPQYGDLLGEYTSVAPYTPTAVDYHGGDLYFAVDTSDFYSAKGSEIRVIKDISCDDPVDSFIIGRAAITNADGSIGNLGENEEILVSTTSATHDADREITPFLSGDADDFYYITDLAVTGDFIIASSAPAGYVYGIIHGADFDPHVFTIAGFGDEIESPDSSENMAHNTQDRDGPIITADMIEYYEDNPLELEELINVDVAANVIESVKLEFKDENGEILGEIVGADINESLGMATHCPLDNMVQAVDYKVDYYNYLAELPTTIEMQEIDTEHSIISKLARRLASTDDASGEGEDTPESIHEDPIEVSEFMMIETDGSDSYIELDHEYVAKHEIDLGGYEVASGDYIEFNDVHQITFDTGQLPNDCDVSSEIALPGFHDHSADYSEALDHMHEAEELVIEEDAPVVLNETLSEEELTKEIKKLGLINHPHGLHISGGNLYITTVTRVRVIRGQQFALGIIPKLAGVVAAATVKGEEVTVDDFRRAFKEYVEEHPLSIETLAGGELPIESPAPESVLDTENDPYAFLGNNSPYAQATGEYHDYPTGSLVCASGEQYDVDGKGRNARFARPQGIVGFKGHLYVADGCNDKIRILAPIK